MAGRSIKRNDPTTVGRFGIGFNSVYHTTDVPGIFSSGHLGLMDPQEKIFGERVGGWQWSLDNTEDQEALMTLHDQFQPFRDIVSLVSGQQWSKVVMEDQHFDGTLFRFPLRHEASEISDNLYDSHKVAELFSSFIADAELCLLFLKTVTSVSLIHIDVHGVVTTKLKVNCSVPTEVTVESDANSTIESLTRFKLITLNSEDRKETKWLVTTCTMKEGTVENLDLLAKKLSFLPRVDLAFPCGDRRDCSESRLSCFLPLPNNEANKTGLPVYVNACFGLTDNRRHIKWREEDQKHDEHALWNHLLMKEVLPSAYVTIIQDAIKLAQESVLPVSTVYDLWPDIGQVQHKGEWYAVALDVFHLLFKRNVAVLSLATDERQFVTPSEAVLPCNGPASVDMLSAIRRTLVSFGENLVTLTASVGKAIAKAYPQAAALTQVTPTFIRDILRRNDLRNIDKEDKLYLLEYVLGDGQYNELKGLQLLPVSDGSFRSFTDREEDTALIDSNTFPRHLLPFCEHLFIPEDLRSTCRDRLMDVARKKLFRVINIDAVDVAEYTRRFLPQDWKQAEAKLVMWDTSSSQHPPSDWLRKFWTFLNTHFDKLSRFTGIPLIPISPLSVSEPVSLAKLQGNTTQIFLKSKHSSLPDQIAQLVERFGGTVVRGNDWLKHEDLDSYVLCPTPRSVMKVLMNLDCQHVIRELEAVSHTAREQLKDYLSHLECLSNQEKDWFSKLPVFQTVKGKYVAAQSKQAVLQLSELTLPPDLPMPDSVILCASEVDRRLLQLLSVHILDTAAAASVLIDCIEKKSCSSRDTEKIMTWILQHGNIIFSQNKALKCRCKDLRFIEANGQLKKSSNFFDCRVEAFKVIFESDYFPPPVYTQTPQMFESLTALGLLNKEEDVSPEHLLHATRVIDKLSVSSHAEALKRARVLLKMLNSTDLLSKFSGEQLHCLKMLKWVPCDLLPAVDKRLLNDQSQSCCLFCPEEIRHSMFKDIVGHAMPLVESLSNSVSIKLGLKSLPPPEKVMENLSFLKLKAQKMHDPNTDVDFKKQLQSIYKHMQDNLPVFVTLMNKKTQWLWNHDDFVSPHDLVLEYPPNLDLSSYIRKVPKEYLPFKKLLLEFGMKMMLSTDEICRILCSIQQTIETRPLPFATLSEVRVSIEILNWLWREKKAVDDDIPVPVIIEGEQFSLKPRSTAVFCDISKNGLKELQYNQEGIYVIHSEIPKATAEWLNIPLLSTYILDPEIVGIEQCGQSEPITTRIKNILKEYDEESDIFKELIQNAEDAGADTCKFLVDFRVHKDSPDRLIDPDMALCQGPCLWAFNNEKFTDEDWKNIVRVGSASKENNMEKIGKFGLGFNTVYHVTDIPSILSGNSLLILDPNVTHLKKHIKHKSNPGIKLNLSQQRLLQCFPGQFGPYERIFKCHFSRSGPPQPYPGTLIKLPFRNEEEANKSEISQKVYQKHDIVTFHEHFTKNSQTHLLFLKKIDTLSLQSISNNVSTPPRDDEIETLFTVSKTTVSAMRVPDETSVSKQCQAEKLLMKEDQKCQEVIDCRSIKVVQITTQKSGEPEVQSWLLYNCFGTQQALKMALQKNKQAKFSLPIGGIAVPLQNNAETGKLSPLKTDLIGQAFCFLPLQIQTGLPVNVNGTFAVTSNRKGLWESGVKSDWNKALLQDPVVSAYVAALLALKKMSENEQLETYRYYDFWPDREKVSATFRPLVDAFYFVLSQNADGPELFSDGEHWCSMNNAIFLHESIEKNEKIGALAAEMCKKFVKAPKYVVPLPPWLRNTFRNAGLEKVLQDQTWNWKKFYQEVVFDNLKSMDQKSRDTLVLHAIDLHVKEMDSLLLQYPCIPTTDGQLQYINKLVNPSGSVSCLFELEDGRLLGGTKQDFCSPKRIQRLLALGMANDELPLEDIADKAGTVATTWSVDRGKAYVHLKCLLGLMKKHMDDESSPHWKRLKTTAFLPAFSPGDTKMKKSVKLKRPTEVFSDKCALLVNMTQSVLDHTKLKIHSLDPVLQILGVCSHPELDTVLHQVKEVSKQSLSTDRSEFHNIAYACYKFLNQWIEDFGDDPVISEWAKSFPFILIGNTFVDVIRVAENEQFQAKPYLHVLPPAFTSFGKLWESVGVEKTFTINQYLTVLKELHTQHGNKRLPNSDLSICVTILNAIQNAKEKPTYDCLVPNEQGVLQHASELCFNDSPWMPVSSEVTLCHEKIPRVLACHFGIKTTRHHTLQSHVAEDISPFAFQFEQKEQLTVRIKNIISAYPAKKDILKELIQNADDAEATEIHFVWDKRHHGKEKTFGKKWNHLQGPALCVFNNRVFTDDDLRGIQQLGEGGKQNSAGKTGKYGVGFNSVFHLTDCPSILTGDKKLCISDPSQKYIESHSGKPQSGVGYHLPDTFKNMYIDVYNSFLPDKFPLKDGTMFRLPLRMGANANSSKISTQAVTERDMEELCSALSEDPEGLVLFLTNIRKIVVHQISDQSGTLETIYEVKKTVPKKNKAEKEAFAKYLRQALQQSDEPVAPHKAFYETVISTSDERLSTWIVAEQFGSFKDGNTGKLTGKLPQAALAARVKLKAPQRIPKEWVVDKFSGQSFCTLPLPGQTGLPVHINGNFEVDAARRSLWKEDGQSLKTNWNETLKQDVIAPLYADLLYHIRLSISGEKVPHGRAELSSFLCFWPTVSKNVGKDWHEMIQEVYRAVKDRRLKVIPVMRTSTRTVAGVTLKECSYEWCDISETELTRALYLTQSTNDLINPILEDLGMKLVPQSTCMDNIWASFKSAGVEVKKVGPKTVRDFLRTRPLNDPTQTDEGLPLPITATLIKDKKRCSQLLSFCLTDFNDLKTITKENSTLLDGLPLLLTSDEVLRVFSSTSPKKISIYGDIFLNYKDQFADYETNKRHLDLLQTLNLVTHLTIPHAVQYIKPLIQGFLTECEIDPRTGLCVPNEGMVKWLKYLWRFLISELEQNSDDKPSQTLGHVRKLLSDCCIVPVVCPRLKNKCFLQTMKEMSSVIPLHLDRDVSSILFKLGFMKLNSAFFSDCNRQVFSHLRSELMDVNDKNSVLDQIYNICPSEFSHLTRDEMKELQNFLQSGVSKDKISEEYKRKLKSLPIFETSHGTRVRIDGPNNVFVLNCKRAHEYPDLFVPPDSKSIFLKDSPENVNLAQILKLEVLSDEEYFMRFILPASHRLTERQLVQCLKLLLSLHLKPNQYDEVISSLKTVRLICSSQGRLEMASYYFDDSVALYKKMLPMEKFVPTKFWDDLCDKNYLKLNGAKDLIKKLGMKHAVSRDDLINFAHQLEHEAEGHSNFEELKQKSSSLLQESLNYVAKNKDQGLLQNLADIKFIFPEKIRTELQHYHQPFAAERTPVKMRGSLISKDTTNQDLIWTSMPIIAVNVQPNLKDMMNKVGAHEQPPSHCVTTNMRNICRSQCNTDQLVKTRAKVFRSSYAYLQANGFEEQQLADIPLVLVEKDTQLLKANAACYALPNDLDFRPYLYKIPSQDVRYEEFFKKIGVENEATVVQYCNVLAEIHADSHDKQQLQPNQQKTVKRAVEQLFKSIQNKGNQALVDEVKILYLPAVDGKLHQSSTLFYNDTVFQAKRLEDALETKVLLLEKLSKCYLGNDTYEHHQLLQSLPLKFRPKMLSGFTEEKAVEELMELCEVGAGCEFSGWFERHLSSAEFKYGLICLIRQQSQGKITQEAATDMCDKTFGRIHIVCCKTLETQLWMDEEELDKTASKTDVFVKRGEPGGCLFYLKHNDDLAPKVLNEVNMSLTKEINSLLGNNISPAHLPVLGQLLMCDDLQDVQKTLATHGIHESTEAESIRLDSPDPGTDIPEEWHHSLDMGILNNFEEGEFVGYSMNGKYVYAVIVEEVPGHSGQLSKRYKIDIGEPEPIEVSCLDLYQFKRETKPKPDASCMDVVPLAGTVPHYPPQPAHHLPATVEEAKREIDKCLAEIWTLPEAEKQKAIKRLYLRWHPDKNPDSEFITTEAFKYLLRRLEELKSGTMRHGTAGASYSSRNSDFSHYYSAWDQQARNDRSSRQRFSRGFHFYNFWARDRDVPRPDKAEAQRWCRQARCDLNAASHDTSTGSTEWCLFKVHQAVEKALIAAGYRRNGRRHTAGSISAAAVQVSRFNPELRDLPRIVGILTSLGVDPKKTQYPSCHSYPHIPNTQFKSENEVVALDQASELLDKVEAYCELK
uniref:Sacsin-like n=2 Tax=Salarias fasciatus TaxID=181472 RepID=A0A672HNF9_SALFA